MRFSRYVCASAFASANGDGEIRTLDPLLARQVLSQLSYTPMDAGLSFRTSLPVFSFVCSLSGLGLSEPFPISLRLWMNFTCFSLLGVGLSGLEPPTSRLSGVRSNRLSYKPIFFFSFGGHLLSHTVSSAVPSAAQVLTIVFGMGTGVSPERIATKKVEFLMNPHN